MSFINLMVNDVWSEADIKARLHAEIRSVISGFAETELNRALQGVSMGLHILSTDEQASLALFKTKTDSVAMLGIAARSDMALLQSVLDYEAAQARLLIDPVTEPATVTTTDMNGVVTTVANPAIAVDTAERVAAQAVIIGATVGMLDLNLLRNPVPIPEPLVTP